MDFWPLFSCGFKIEAGIGHTIYKATFYISPMVNCGYKQADDDELFGGYFICWMG